MHPTSTKKRHRFRAVDVVVVLGIVGILAGFLIVGVQSARLVEARAQSQNNLMQLGIAVNNYHPSGQGKIPPSFGEATVNEKKKNVTLFYHLLPQLEAANLQNMEFTETKAPALKVLEAALDVSNPGGQGLTSYCTNASLFGAPKDPKAPMTNLWAIYNLKGSTNLIMFGERYAALNTTWTSPHCFIYGATKGSEIQFNVTPQTAKEGQSPGYCQAFTSAGCQVSMGDASVRNINNVGANPTTNFVIACDPKSTDLFTSDW